MTVCREFGMSPADYEAQPADMMLRWQQYLVVEADARETRRKLDEARSRRVSRGK